MRKSSGFIKVSAILLIAAFFVGSSPWQLALRLFEERHVVDTLYLSLHDTSRIVDSRIVANSIRSFAPKAYADGNTDAMVVYDTLAGTSSVQYRIWNGSSWGSTGTTSPFNGTEVRWTQLKYAPTRDEAIMVVLTNTGEVQAQVFDGSSWGSAITLSTLSDADSGGDGGSLYRGFDIEYEQSSGDAIVVAGDGTADPNYYVWDGSSWGSGVDINIPTTGRPYWIELATATGTDELAMITLDSNSDVYGMRWDGSAWDNMGVATTWDAAASIATRQAVDVAFETNSGDIMFLWGDSVTADDHNYRTYSGTTLGSITALANANAGGQPSWVRLVPNPNPSSDEIMLGTHDAAGDLSTYIWSGSAWSAVHTEHDATTESANGLERDFDIVFETHSSNPDDAWLLWNDGATISRKLWSAGAWGSATTMGDDNNGIVLNAHPNSGAVFALVYEDDTSATDDIRTASLTGGSQTWGSLSNVWDGPTRRNIGFIRIALSSQFYSASTEAMMAYVTDDSVTYPQYRRWTGSSWGSQASTSPIAGELRHMVLKAAPTRDELVLVTAGNAGHVQAQIYDGTSGTWGSATILNTMNNANGDRDLQSLYRGFDVEYESSSGDAIVVTGDGTADPNYHVWDGSSWTGPTDINIPNTGRPNWIELATPLATTTNDSLAMILIDSAVDVYGMRWTGSAWDNMGTAAVWDATGSIATEKSIDVAFETNSGDIMFIWGDSVSTDQYYRTYSGTTLSAATLLDHPNAGNVNNWMVLAANPRASTTADQILYAVLDGGSDINTFMWSGSAWSAAHTEHTAAAETNAVKTIDIAFETHSSNPDDAWLVYGDGATLSRKLWDGATQSWGSATTQGDDTDLPVLNAHPNSGAVFLAAYESSASASDDITYNTLTSGSQTWGSAAQFFTGPVARTALPLTKLTLASERYLPPVFAQQAYRFFANLNSTDVGSALAAQDTGVTLSSSGEAFRLRTLLRVDTSDLSTSGQDFKLQFIGKGGGSCASPSGGTPSSWTDVNGATVIAYNDNASPADGAGLTANANDPIDSGRTIVNQTYEETNNFTNSQSAIPSGQDGKWDFALIDNGAPGSTTYCLRVVESDGTTLLSYAAYPEVTTANTPPTASATTIDSGAASVILTEGSTKNVLCAGTVTDNDGYPDIQAVGAWLFRTSTGTSTPVDDNERYYRYGDSQCVPSGGAGNSETYTCTFAVQYFADPTDVGAPYASDDWTCEMWPEDAIATGTPAIDGIEMGSLVALDVTSSINYGTVNANADTGAVNQSTTITNTGNRDMDPELSGANMTDGGINTIPVGQQKYGTAAFTYTVGGTALSTTPTTIDLTLPQRTSGAVTDTLHWGLGVPNGTPVGTYTGTNTFTAVEGL